MIGQDEDTFPSSHTKIGGAVFLTAPPHAALFRVPFS